MATNGMFELWYDHFAPDDGNTKKPNDDGSPVTTKVKKFKHQLNDTNQQQ